MLPTYITALVGLLAVWLWRSGVSALVALVAGVLVLGGSAALVLPALGGTSVTPAHFAILAPLLWLVVRRDQAGVLEAISINRWLIAFAVIGAVSAFILPRLFAGDINVTPMRPTRLDYVREALAPTTQNITQAIYLLGTAVAAVLASYSARYGARSRDLFLALLIAGGAHVVFGLLDVFGVQQVLDVLRNATYAQLNQDFGKLGVRRIAGSFPEASQFATFGFGVMVLSGELWMRNIWPRVSGAICLLNAVMLVLSTSSTAYLCLAVYLPLMLLRLLFLTSGPQKLGKGLTLFGLGLGGVILGLIFVAVSPQVAQSLQSVVESMTVGKLDTASGRERMAWATQGLEAFAATKGVGIGIGSFRSSSLLTAVIGSTGVIGVVTLAAYIIQVLAPWRAAAYRLDLPRDQAFGEAAATAAVLSLLPAVISSPQADPGLLFGLLAGYALGARLAPVTAGPAPATGSMSRLEMRRQRLRQRSA